MKLSQEQYTKELVQEYGMESGIACSTPMSSNHYKYILGSEGPAISSLAKAEQETYIAILESLSSLTMCTRLDIAFDVSVLSIYQSILLHIHKTQAKRVLRYLIATPSIGVPYGDTSLC
mmetsp:Transcript_20850/g.52620  ORF Transcript_20850/g.52620 Transcript_20850/m.52620 type:complete len:119 (+) Transcript_20850:1985-2341(+)